MLTTNFDVYIHRSGKKREFDFLKLSEKEQNALIMHLENDLDNYRLRHCECSEELIKNQLFESLVIQLHHAKQAAYQDHARALMALNSK